MRPALLIFPFMDLLVSSWTTPCLALDLDGWFGWLLSEDFLVLYLILCLHYKFTLVQSVPFKVRVCLGECGYPCFQDSEKRSFLHPVADTFFLFFLFWTKVSYHNEIPLHTYQDGCSPKKGKSQILLAAFYIVGGHLSRWSRRGKQAGSCSNGSIQNYPIT